MLEPKSFARLRVNAGVQACCQLQFGIVRLLELVERSTTTKQVMIGEWQA
jgi:hypothetical protein